MINFNVPPYTGSEDEHVLSAMRSSKISGDGPYSKKCQAWFEGELKCSKALLVPSCTHALEMAAILIGVGPGDEVIMPSFTFVSTANAFALRGAKIVFVDIRPDTMNINEQLIESAITAQTKVIVPVHYAGVACDMDVIMSIADRYGIYVVEDAAQGMMSTYKGRALGTIGHIGAFSFHETKNYTSGGEGGLLIVNDAQFVERSEIIREKGTDRSKFFRGLVDKYSWVDIGSSYLMSDLQAAFLWGQLEKVNEINASRLAIWDRYFSGLSALVGRNILVTSEVHKDRTHNAHMFYLKLKDINQRTQMLDHLKTCGVMAVFHYVPLHSSLAGKLHSRFHGVDNYTTAESERLIRLPIWYGMKEAQVDHVVNSIKEFY
ncbi:dTDP-4-amino-4,6-dideoxygalactose transaminase [Pseudomonas sp. TH21]|jgi:dTDP-4-amino-4,6-dideoxygalactose transaminase|uniref:dTDP-4-amino-4,6-dideoxygalactose transaminase n=1 Tax=Pseudomonas sp. TH21 TaxID=2796387 RepID=UPI001911EBD5|nr:dTDP-4-amino-4,6-dideoxygalactose transaminase [Pseudomonas sp. TH21]MBK5477881.1 dTDP-4-amino-4,6-dideoxygalactose transaminase [Pseudomonas sp. TH21]